MHSTRLAHGAVIDVDLGVGERELDFEAQRAIVTLGSSIRLQASNNLVLTFDLEDAGAPVGTPIRACAIERRLQLCQHIHAPKVELAQVSRHVDDIERVSVAWLPVRNLKVEPVGVALGVSVHLEQQIVLVLVNKVG